MSQALIITVMSMGIVFLALLAISYIISGFEKVFYKRDNKTVVKKDSQNKKVTKNMDNEKDKTDEDEEELIAVIAAAIAANLSKSIKDIKIRSIRRVPQSTSIWAKAGREEQIYNKL
ncbi:hypothetical protein BET03_08055 [Thermohalobacter berrensis]|uniref:Uncharacterized protein n=2 Tax=Thermohalobacter berrensis TaxID=99594 RepID=A0A419T8Y9_9FIRM|nr:hypothetical protein BET03_08055 [Thermohalobacter berrensis]